ncbi:MAG: CoA-binding protein [Chloroflexi bacterium]|nr:CoA-binding protein [Chloroflexota bacterium]
MTDDSPSTRVTSKRQSRDDLLRIYRESVTIAVVGASTNADRPAHYVPLYLQSQGYRIIPISPRGGEIFGEPVLRALDEAREPIDIVDVFRPANEGPEIARDAARIGAKVVWFQPGTQSGTASAIAAAAGLAVVTRLCLGTTHGTLGLGPGPEHVESD